MQTYEGGRELGGTFIWPGPDAWRQASMMELEQFAAVGVARGRATERANATSLFDFRAADRFSHSLSFSV
jgi:hypothetical protein